MNPYTLVRNTIKYAGKTLHAAFLIVAMLMIGVIPWLAFEGLGWLSVKDVFFPYGTTSVLSWGVTILALIVGSVIFLFICVLVLIIVTLVENGTRKFGIWFSNRESSYNRSH